MYSEDNGESKMKRAERLARTESIPPGVYEVYVLELLRFDGEEFYYVGMAKNVVDRLQTHIGVAQDDYDEGKVSMPTPEGKLGAPSYDVVDLERRVRGGGTKDEARETERRMAYEIALEYDTTNVLGGK